MRCGSCATRPSWRPPPTSIPSRPDLSCPRASCWARCCSRSESPRKRWSEFERLAAAEPNRLLPLYNAARAAEATGDTAKAHAYYQKLLALTAKRDTERPEIARARAHVALN